MGIVAIGLRVATLPLSVVSARAARERAEVMPEIEALLRKKKEIEASDVVQKRNDLVDEIQGFKKKHGMFFVFKGMGDLALVQLPLYVTGYTVLKHMAANPEVYPGFDAAGPLWLDSLAQPDPLMLLPTITAGLILTNAMQAIVKVGGEREQLQKSMARILALAYIPLTQSVP